MKKTTTNYKKTTQPPESWEKRFDLQWGIAPKGSLKYLKGEEIKEFIRKEIQREKDGIIDTIQSTPLEMVGFHDGDMLPATFVKFDDIKKLLARLK